MRALGITLPIGAAGLGFSQMPEPLRSILSEMAAGRYSKAQRGTRAALSQSPQDPRIWRLDGLSLARSGRPKEALQSYDHALQLTPHYLPAMHLSITIWRRYKRR